MTSRRSIATIAATLAAAGALVLPTFASAQQPPPYPQQNPYPQYPQQQYPQQQGPQQQEPYPDQPPQNPQPPPYPQQAPSYPQQSYPQQQYPQQEPYPQEPQTSGPRPSYALPEPTYAQKDYIRGTLNGFDGQWIVYMHDSHGYNDHISLHQGTVINPTGTRLVEGMQVVVYGYSDHGTYQANRVDVLNWQAFTPYPGYNVGYGSGYGYGYGGYPYYGGFYPGYYGGWYPYGLGFGL
ncbi:MAG TPA: hypothetical protein VHR97_08695, partial [Candidatus Baltobacteraceae bacterium]|nr:hypothetical protein [Candidatus Baltobacteraceae bacterium]